MKCSRRKPFVNCRFLNTLDVIMTWAQGGAGICTPPSRGLPTCDALVRMGDADGEWGHVGRQEDRSLWWGTDKAQVLLGCKTVMGEWQGWGGAALP